MTKVTGGKQCQCGATKDLLEARYEVNDKDKDENLLSFSSFICKTCYLTKNKFAPSLSMGIQWHSDEELEKFDWDYNKIKESKKEK